MKRTELMEWSAEQSLNVPVLDTQHQKLVEFFNGAINTCSGEKTEEKKYFDKEIGPFISSLEEHFKTEEQFMSGINYPQLDGHKLDHTKLLEKINYVKAEIQNGRWEMKLFILTTTLKDWFMYHFNSYDLTIKQFFDGEQTGGGERFAFPA